MGTEEARPPLNVSLLSVGIGYSSPVWLVESIWNLGSSWKIANPVSCGEGYVHRWQANQSHSHKSLPEKFESIDSVRFSSMQYSAAHTRLIIVTTMSRFQFQSIVDSGVISGMISGIYTTRITQHKQRCCLLAPGGVGRD